MKKSKFDYRESKNKKSIELWTGIKDKNGKKIFEGDKIRFFGSEKLTYEIKFFDFGFKVWHERLGEVSTLKYVRQIRKNVEIIC